MKKQFFFLLVFSALFLVISSCSKGDSVDELSEQDQKEIVLALFNASSGAVNQGMNNQSSAVVTKSTENADLRSSSYPVKYTGTYDVSDGKGGSIHLTVNLGGAINYNQDPYQCLGGFILINIAEDINHFRVPLTNGREVYLDTDQSVTFSGTFKLQAGCTTFDPVDSNFRIQGKYMCNGIEYSITLLGFINADGTCDRISGTVNGIMMNFDF